MKIQNSKFKNALILSATVITIAFTACKEETPKPADPPVNENELITTVKIILRDSASNILTTFAFRDIDGEGGNAPSQFDTIKLKANKTYIAEILLLDESKSTVDTISKEVFEEAKDHLFVFTPSNPSLSIRILDTDDNNLPIGLYSEWKSTLMFNGTLKIALKHQPDIKTGDANLGETDLDVTFPCVVK